MNFLNKKTPRKRYLNKRQLLSVSHVINKSKIISRKLLSLGNIKDKKIFSLYLPINNEVETYEIINKLSGQKKTIVVPRYFGSSKNYHFVKFLGWQDLEEGPHRIPQPNNQRVFEQTKIEVAILPGLAFSKDGLRLGYGEGVFDRLLAKSKAIKIGLAFDFQVDDQIAQEKHDLVMDVVVTEERIIIT